MSSKNTDRSLDQYERQLRRRLDMLPRSHELERIAVHPQDKGAEAGTRPSLFFLDEAGHKYFFKQAEPAHIAAEIFAYRIRRLGGRPAIPCARRTLELKGVGAVEGLLQPFIDNPGTTLPLDMHAWTPFQREAMLREHPWEWLTANLDTHADQYILVDRVGYPLNIDQDHALVDIEVTQLTRFNRRSPAIAPVRNLLYDAFANEGLHLSFYCLRREAARAHVLSERACAHALDQYATSLELGDAARKRLFALFFQRKRSILRDFDKLVISMLRERIDARSSSIPMDRRMRRAVTAVQDGWQRFSIRILHDRILRRGFKTYKAYLEELLKRRTAG